MTRRRRARAHVEPEMARLAESPEIIPRDILGPLIEMCARQHDHAAEPPSPFKVPLTTPPPVVAPACALAPRTLTPPASPAKPNLGRDAEPVRGVPVPLIGADRHASRQGITVIRCRKTSIGRRLSFPTPRITTPNPCPMSTFSHPTNSRMNPEK